MVQQGRGARFRVGAAALAGFLALGTCLAGTIETADDKDRETEPTGGEGQVTFNPTIVCPIDVEEPLEDVMDCFTENQPLGYTIVQQNPDPVHSILEIKKVNGNEVNGIAFREGADRITCVKVHVDSNKLVGRIGKLTESSSGQRCTGCGQGELTVTVNGETGRKAVVPTTPNGLAPTVMNTALVAAIQAQNFDVSTTGDYIVVKADLAQFTPQPIHTLEVCTFDTGVAVSKVEIVAP